MKFSKYNLIYIILLLFIDILGFSACSTNNNNNSEESTTDSAELIEIEETSVSASGEVIPLVKAELSFQNNAKYLQVKVGPGDYVTEGDVLIESDNLQQIADIQSAEARLADAEATYDILKRNFATKIEQNAAKANIEAAAAEVELALENLRLNKIVAPFSGKVIEVYVNSYEDVLAGESVILLADTQTHVIETTDLNEIDVKKISIGSEAEIFYDAFPETKILGEVTDIKLKSASGSGVNYTVAITPFEKLDNIRWGMSTFVVIETGSK